MPTNEWGDEEVIEPNASVPPPMAPSVDPYPNQGAPNTNLPPVDWGAEDDPVAEPGFQSNRDEEQNAILYEVLDKGAKDAAKGEDFKPDPNDKMNPPEVQEAVHMNKLFAKAMEGSDINPQAVEKAGGLQKFVEGYEKWKAVKPALDAADEIAKSTTKRPEMWLIQQNDPKQRQAFLDELRAKWEAAPKGSYFEKKNWIHYIPFVGASLKAEARFKLNDQVEALRDHEEGKIELPPDKLQEYTRDVWGKLLDLEEMRAKGVSLDKKAVNGVMQAIPFMLEMVATGGIAAGVRGAAIGGLTKLTGAATVQGVKGAALRGGIQVAGVAAGEAARLPFFVGMAAEKYAENVAPDYTVTTDGKVQITGEGDKPATAVLKAVGTTYIELLTEQSGEGIKAGTAGAAKLLGKGFSKYIPTVGKFMGKLTTKLGEAWSKATGGPIAEFAKKMLTKAGFHGVLEEMGEERLGDVLRAVTGAETFGLKGDENTLKNRLLKAIPDGEQLLVEAATFAIIGGGSAAAQVGANAAFKAKDLISEDAFETWAKYFPEKAKKLAEKDTLSRSAFKSITEMPGESSAREREQIRQYAQRFAFEDRAEQPRAEAAVEPESVSQPQGVNVPQQQEVEPQAQETAKEEPVNAIQEQETEEVKVEEAPRPTEAAHVAPDQGAEAEGLKPAKSKGMKAPETGKPYEFEFIRNTEKSPFMGARFGQDVEPAGTYMQEGKKEHIKDQSRMISGTVKFDNPLVVEFGGGYGEKSNWKNVLSEQFGGKRRKALSQAIRDAGHDGIITVDITRGVRNTSEIVDLRMFDKSSPAPAPAKSKGVKPDEASLESLAKETPGRYWFQGVANGKQSSWVTSNPEKAKQYAQKHPNAVINVFTPEDVGSTAFEDQEGNPLSPEQYVATQSQDTVIQTLSRAIPTPRMTFSRDQEGQWAAAPIEAPAKSKGVKKGVITKTTLIDELVGPQPEGAAASADWKKSRKDFGKWKKAELEKKVQTLRETKGESAAELEVVKSLQPEVQQVADEAGAKWKSALKEHVEGQGGRVNNVKTATKSEAVFQAAKAIAQVKKAPTNKESLSVAPPNAVGLSEPFLAAMREVRAESERLHQYGADRLPRGGALPFGADGVFEELTAQSLDLMLGDVARGMPITESLAKAKETLRGYNQNQNKPRDYTTQRWDQHGFDVLDKQAATLTKAAEKEAAPSEAKAATASKVDEKWAKIKGGERVAVSAEELDQIESQFSEDPEISWLASTAFSAKSFEAFLKPNGPSEARAETAEEKKAEEPKPVVKESFTGEATQAAKTETKPPELMTPEELGNKRKEESIAEATAKLQDAKTGREVANPFSNGEKSKAGLIRKRTAEVERLQTMPPSEHVDMWTEILRARDKKQDVPSTWVDVAEATMPKENPHQAQDNLKASGYVREGDRYVFKGEAKVATEQSPRIAQIDAELARLQKQYEDKMNKQSRSGMVPPSIKSDALRGIARRMDKLDAEKDELLAPTKVPVEKKAAPKAKVKPVPTVKSKGVKKKPAAEAITKKDESPKDLYERNLHQKMVNEYRHIFEGDLPARVRGGLPAINMGHLNIKPIKAAVSRKKSKVDSLSNIMAREQGRYAINGVFHDAKENRLVATDGHKMVVLEEKIEGESRTINPKTNETIEGMFPKWQQVIPKSYDLFSIEAKTLHEAANGALKAGKLQTEPDIFVLITGPGKKVLVDPRHLVPALQALREQGAEQVGIGIAKGNALVLTHKKNIAVVMGITSEAKGNDYGSRVEFDITKGEVITRVDEGLVEPAPTVKDSKAKEKAPDDVKHKIHVVRVNGGEIKEAFPGATVERAADGKSWSVTLQGGGSFRVELRSDIPVDVPTIMSTYGVSQKEAENMAAEGAAGAVLPAGIEISLSDGKTYTPEKIIALFDPDKADRGTVRHEALHLAKELGLFDTPSGKRIWDALSLEYGSEEKIAQAREVWEGQNGIWQKIRQWASVWLSKLGFDLDPDVAMSETFSERFWSQGAGLGTSGVKYSLRTDVALTSIKNEVAEELRRQRGEGELEGVVPEVAQQWLDDAVSTMALDNNAGNRLVMELDGNARILSPRETALLQMYYRSATNNFERVSEALFAAEKGGDSVKIAQAQIEADHQMAILAQIEEAAKKAGSEWGRAGVARQIVLAKDFSMAAMVRKMRVANGGKQVSKEELNEIAKQAERIKRLEGRLKEMEAAAAEAEMKPAIEKQIAEDIKSSEASKPKSKGTKVKTKKSEALLKIKSRWEKLGNLFTAVKEKPEVAASGAKYQLKAGAQTSEGDFDSELYEGAKELAEVYIEDGMTSATAFWNVAKQHLGANASQAEASFRKAWADAAAAEGLEAPKLGFDDPRAMTREARMIQRQLVDAGMRDHKQILNAVHEAMQDSNPELTLKDTKAILSAYGQFTPVSKEESDVLIRDMNGQLLELSKLDALEEGEPLRKTGMQRPEPTEEHRRLIQQVYEAKKRAGYGLVTAKKAIDNRIADLNWEIKNKQAIVRNRTEMVVDTELLEKRKERDELLKIRRELIPAKKATEEQKIAAALRWMDKAIADLEAKLKVGDISPRAKVSPLSSPELEAKRTYLKSLQAQRKALRDQANPKKTKEERDRSNYEANLRRRIADYTLRITEQDFERKPKEPRKLSDDEMKLKRRLEETKQEFWKAAAKKKLENMSPAERTLDYAMEVMNLMRAMKTSFDVSAVHRQGGIVAVAHPLLAKEAYAEMVKAMVSKQANFNSAEAIRNDPLGQFAMTAGLSISNENGDITRQEEVYQGRWAKRIPGVAASGRAYATFLNNIRFGLFKLMVENIGKNGQVTMAEAKVIATYINVATGRGDFKALNKAAANMNVLFFATRWVASRFQYMAMPAYLPFTKTSWRVKKAIATEYARTFTGAWAFAGTLMALAYLAAGDDEEQIPTMSFDPRSSDFLKIKIGETRIDPFFGLQQAMVVSAKLWTGEKVNTAGKVVSLTDAEGFNADTRLSVGARFARTKLAPVPGAIVTVLDDMTDVVGKKHTYFSLGIDLFKPLSLSDVATAIEGQGVTKGMAKSMLTLHGVGTGTYGPRTKYLAGTEEERVKQFKNDLTNAEWNDGPLAYSDQMTEEMLKKYDMAKKKHGGRMLFYLTRDKPDLRAYTKKYRASGEAKDKYEEALKEWNKKRTRATDSLKGFPTLDAKDYLNAYLKSRGRKSVATGRELRDLIKTLNER